MNVCLISTPFLMTPPSGYGGLERVVWDLANGLIKSGHKVVLIGAEGSQKLKGGFTIEAIPCTGSTDVNWAEEEKKMWNVYDSIISSMDFDIIHGHNWFGFEYATKAKHRELKVCHTHHGHLNMGWWGQSKPDFDLNMIGISDWMVQNYEALGFRSKRVYNGVDLSLYPYSTQRDNERLLFVGRITEYKQPHIAIKVAQKVGMPIDIVGGTFVDNEVYLHQIMSIAEGDDNIEIYLDASHDKKVELMQNARALLFPSNMGEPFGLVSVEAMSTGCPVIALNDGAIKEIVNDTCGRVIVSKSKDQQIEDMAKAVVELDINGKDCRKRAEEFSIDKMCSNYVTLYKNIVSGKEW